MAVAAVLLGLGEAGAQPAVTQGALRVLDKNGNVQGECPLKHTDVQADISSFIARVRVTQEFQNPYSDKIEAVYVFPLPQDGAVDEMVMQVGERRIVGQIKPREEARRIYEAAKAQGHVASLLDQERPNIFTQSVANIMPGEQVKVTISYVEILNYEDGVYQFVFPMVVGPRYIPGGATGRQGTGWAPDTTRVPDASHITPPVTPEGMRAGHDVSVCVRIQAGLALGEIASKLHEVVVESQGPSGATVALRKKAVIPNKDFILRYTVAGAEIGDALLMHASRPGDGFFTLILQPPKRVAVEKVAPKEMIFVIDSSGSQMGWPIEKAKETMKLCIERMNPDDTFNLLAFSNNTVALFDRPQPNTEDNRERALRFLGERLGSGGTEMMKAILAALTPPPDAKRLRIVCFMTDGFVGNDFEIIDGVKRNLGQARFFSFGVGNSVNRFLLDKMAEEGRGAVEYVTLNTPGEQAARKFHERIANPILTDISVDWGRLPVRDVYPKLLPDLFSSRPLVIRGRYTEAATGTLTVRGRVGGQLVERRIEVRLPDLEPGHDVLAPLWARARIDELMSQDYMGMQRGEARRDVKEAITNLGLEFRLMTQYTSFVAVEEMVITEGGQPRTVAVPVEMPEGVSYRGVFGEGQANAPRAAKVKAGACLGFAAAAAPATARPMEVEAKECDDRAIGPPPKATPAERRAWILEQRLDDFLRGLAEKVAREGRDGNLKLSKVEVKGGMVEVQVWLSDASDAAIEKLKAAGLEVLLQPRAGKLVIGRIKVELLETLALLDVVKFVEPARLGG
jgi:Ca-activated chloride channel family protein